MAGRPAPRRLVYSAFDAPTPPPPAAGSSIKRMDGWKWLIAPRPFRQERVDRGRSEVDGTSEAHVVDGGFRGT